MHKALQAGMRLIGVEELRRIPRLLLQLSYPSGDRCYALEVLDAIIELGVDALGLKSELSLAILGKGFRNIVIGGQLGDLDVAVKVRRSDYVLKSTLREAEMLIRANRLGIGPRFYGRRDPVIVMGLVQGVDISRWLADQASPPLEVIKVLRSIATQCFRLDAARIDHGELSDASRHVIVTSSDPCVIDFGSAKPALRPRNLTSFINYLQSKRLDKVGRELGLTPVSRERLREYKETYSHEVFNEILVEAGLDRGEGLG